MIAASPYLILVGRVLLALIFVSAGWDKVPNYSATQQYMESFGLPGALLPLVIALELGGGLAVLAGFFTRWAALLLALFTLAAGLVFHTPFGDQNQAIHFVKNLAIAGGLLVLAGAGPGAYALDNRR